MICPECGAPMKLRQTDKLKYKNGESRKFYGCSNYPECKGAHGADPEGKTLGFPANAKTKAMRIKAHAVLEAYYAGMTRKEIYKRLQEIMQMSAKQAHIAKFTMEQCQQLIDRIKFKMKMSAIGRE